MGCISSKDARPGLPVPYGVVSSENGKRRGRSGSDFALLLGPAAFGPLENIMEEPEKEGIEDSELDSGGLGKLKTHTRGSSRVGAVFSFKFGRLTEGELVAAGWPTWLSSVAGEAIDGWLPMRSDSFERLDKIGQGTYSDVYRARQVETGRIMAIKKVKFNNFRRESVRFMAREISILRRLSHPNVMKLEGIIASPSSSHVYLVFEYMEHDLAGLLASPDIRFTDAQIKCYMRQILSGVEHCHSRGILHRDIKTSNILVNNDGILKLADFGLANFMRPKNKQPLTSRVVTLWYRPPELLLGSTEYGEAVDLWSVGCVFAELFVGKPILKGRTEVDQLHKIFKLCGSPPDDYWKKSKLPLANMFKPRHSYESTLHERSKELPECAVDLIETFLSIEPHKRRTASSALNSKYFNTKPYACDPASLPKYPPSKEIDAKYREARRRAETMVQPHSGSQNARRVQKPLQELTDFKAIPTEVAEANHTAPRNQDASINTYYQRSGDIASQMAKSETSLKPLYNTMPEASQLTQEPQGSQTSATNAVPVQALASKDHAWQARQKHDRPVSRNQRQISIELPWLFQMNDSSDSDEHEDDDSSDMDNSANPASPKSSNLLYEPQEPYLDASNKKKKGKVTFSGPVIYEYEQATSNEHAHLQSRCCEGPN